MKFIKKASIVTGAVIGGVIGGSLCVIGKVSHRKFIDDLGESIVDSAILTGSIAGTAASGAEQILSGKIKHDGDLIKKGSSDLKEAGGEIVHNVVSNFKIVTESSGEIVKGVKERNKRKVVRSTKRLIKVIAVGAITVGAIKIKDEPCPPPAPPENDN